jgi:hypothetical protein
MDQSSFGLALDGSDLGGNEVQAVRVVSVSHRSDSGGIIVAAKTARSCRAAIAWGLDESVVLPCPGLPSLTAEPGRVIVFGERTFRFVVCRFPVDGIVRQSFCGGWR